MNFWPSFPALLSSSLMLFPSSPSQSRTIRNRRSVATSRCSCRLADRSQPTWEGRSTLETPGQAENGGSSSGEHDLSPIADRENKAAIPETRSAQVAQVDDTSTVSAEEEGIVQPALAVVQTTVDENLVCAEPDQCLVVARFQDRDVPKMHDPGAEIISQKNEIVASKDSTRCRWNILGEAAIGQMTRRCNDSN